MLSQLGLSNLSTHLGPVSSRAPVMSGLRSPTWLILSLTITVHCAVEEDIRQRIVLDLGMTHIPDIQHVSPSFIFISQSNFYLVDGEVD